MSRRNQSLAFRKPAGQGLSKAPLRQVMVISFLSRASRLLLASWLSFPFLFPSPTPAFLSVLHPGIPSYSSQVWGIGILCFLVIASFVSTLKMKYLLKVPPPHTPKLHFLFAICTYQSIQRARKFYRVGGSETQSMSEQRRQMKPEAVAVNYGIKLAQAPSLYLHFPYF